MHICWKMEPRPRLGEITVTVMEVCPAVGVLSRTTGLQCNAASEITGMFISTFGRIYIYAW